MKKVILSLVLVGALTVVSCKKAEEAPVEEAVETVEEVVEEAPVAVDTLATEETEEAAN
jgi:PBP1b-binding outer membrane lipoprotein LpoB